MRRWALACALVLCAGASSAEVKKGDRAASIKGARTASGKALTLESLRGQVVVLTFGASWCKPCRKELPALDKVAIELVKKQKKKVKFVAVNLDDEEAEGKRFMKGLSLDCVTPLYDTRGRVASSYRPRVMPSTYIIDSKGIVRHVHKGYDKGDENKIAAKVRALLE